MIFLGTRYNHESPSLLCCSVRSPFYSGGSSKAMHPGLTGKCTSKSCFSAAMVFLDWRVCSVKLQLEKPTSLLTSSVSMADPIPTVPCSSSVAKGLISSGGCIARRAAELHKSSCREACHANRNMASLNILNLSNLINPLTTNEQCWSLGGTSCRFMRVLNGFLEILHGSL